MGHGNEVIGFYQLHHLFMQNANTAWKMSYIYFLLFKKIRLRLHAFLWSREGGLFLY